MSASNMHIKINFVGSFTGVPCDEDTTASNVVEFILSRYEIPLEYAPLCCLLEIRPDTYGYPVPADEKMVKFANSASNLNFRILAVPMESPIKQLHAGFLEILSNQFNRLILTRTWTVMDQDVMKLAALRCGCEFGSFNPLTHKKGFFAKTLAQYVPADIIAALRESDIETRIFEGWKSVSEQKLVESHQQAIVSYLEFCQSNVKQYGCATFVGRLLKIDKDIEDVYCYLSVSTRGFLILGPDGEDLASFGFDAQFEWPPENSTKVKVTANNKIYTLEMNGATATRLVVEFIMNCRSKV